MTSAGDKRPPHHLPDRVNVAWNALHELLADVGGKKLRIAMNELAAAIGESWVERVSPIAATEVLAELKKASFTTKAGFLAVPYLMVEEAMARLSAIGATDEARTLLELLVGLKLIKRRIEAGTATVQDTMIYNTTKEAIWEKAEALFPNLRSADEGTKDG